MKKYIKYVLCFFVGIIFTLSIGCFAVFSYNASQITYSKNNVEIPLSDAIDELYTTSNTTIDNLNTELNMYATLNFDLYLTAHSSTQKSDSYISLQPFHSRYRYFTVSSPITVSGEAKNLKIFGYKGGKELTITSGTKYESTYTNAINMESYSNTDGVMARTYINITFSNE